MIQVFGLMLAMLVAISSPAGAQRPGDEIIRGVTANEAHADYQMYAHGLRIAHFEAGFDLGPRNYRMEVAFRTFGLVGFLFHGHQLSSVAGSWNGTAASPAQFVGDGFWRGAVHRTILDYVQGHPTLREQTPSNVEDNREEVPVEMLPGTKDTLSAMAELMRVASTTGRCELSLRTYDGRRLVQVTAHTMGYEDLPSIDRSIFSGRALRCNFESRLLAGSHHGDSANERAHERGGSAWLAQIVPGAPLLPVRLVFETLWFGDATMYITAAGPGSTRNPATD